MQYLAFMSELESVPQICHPSFAVCEWIDFAAYIVARGELRHRTEEAPVRLGSHWTVANLCFFLNTFIVFAHPPFVKF
jgi:hypothetical protein